MRTCLQISFPGSTHTPAIFLLPPRFRSESRAIEHHTFQLSQIINNANNNNNTIWLLSDKLKRTSDGKKNSTPASSVNEHCCWLKFFVLAWQWVVPAAPAVTLSLMPKTFQKLHNLLLYFKIVNKLQLVPLVLMALRGTNKGVLIESSCKFNNQ